MGYKIVTLLSFLTLWFMGTTAQALMVSPITPEQRIGWAKWACLFEVKEQKTGPDEYGYPATFYSLLCVEPIKCVAGEIIKIKMYGTPNERGSMVKDLPAGTRFVGFLTAPSRLGFVQFVGLPGNGLFLQKVPGQVQTPEFHTSPQERTIPTQQLIQEYRERLKAKESKE